jgi:RND family efflux transporter MFP subunit
MTPTPVRAEHIVKLFLSRPVVLALAVLALASSGAPAFAQTHLRVATVTAESTAAESTFSLTGEIVARDTLTASFALGGRITDVFVTTGSKVQKGDILAKIDQVQQEQTLRAAEAGVVSAKASHQQAREDSERQDTLLERGATTRSARDSAADLLRAAEAQEAQAVADLDRAKKALADTVLLAPTAATVTDRLAEPGQVVGAAQAVVDLALGDAFDALFEVPEATLTATPKSPEVTLSALATPQKTGLGLLREVSPLVDPAKGTVKVTVSVETLPPGLSYGDPVRGTVTTQDEDRVTLPWSSITAQASGPAVWVIDPETNQATLRAVSVLRYLNGQVVLNAGIEAGEIVVSKGTQLLYPGQTVAYGSEVK